ncbi:DegT/DnrJ/EryC1/StrS family aminotransferase [Nonomuraea sp. NPDC059007]
MTGTLALMGGRPVTDLAWPQWPRPQADAGTLLTLALESGRWALSGEWKGHRTNEQRFAERFAAYNEIGHCVPTANGTSALTIALEALEVGADDDVLIPGLTWVASASSVLNVNAVPVLVDVDPETLCIDPDALEAAITPRTRAISVVHLYCSMADMDRILDIGRRHGLPVIEDCAQAHGARWNGRRAGTMGAIGTFSMQQTKLLTAGEGGATITDDAWLADRLFQLRADGRRLATGSLLPRDMELVENSSVMGNNYCLSEFGAALLLDQLAVLDQEHQDRAANAELLTRLLEKIPGVRPVRPAASVTMPTYYHYAIRLDLREFGGKPLRAICRALRAELGYPVQPCYPALNANPLYQPHTKRRYSISADHERRIDPAGYKLPEATRAHEEVLTMHHPFLLGGEGSMEAVAAAFSKVRTLVSQVPV